MTRIGVFSAYPDEDWHAQQLAAAASLKGDVRILSPTDLAAAVDFSGARVLVAGEEASRFDLFLTPRALGDDGDAELQLELYACLVESGAIVVNEARALITAIDKFRTSWLLASAGLPTPRVIVAQRLEEACRALAEMRRAVVKPLYGSLGIGVERLEVDDAPRLGELLARHRALYLQAYVADAELDVRAFVVGDRVEAAVARRPLPGEFRANIHQGAGAEEIVLDAETARVAVRATALLGLDYAGVDLLITPSGPTVLEVNGTPCFQGVNQATGRNMAEAIVEHALWRVTRREREKWRTDRKAI